MTKNKVAEKQNDIIYYCNMHNTMIDSDEYNEKGKKKKIAKCNARIYYNKSENKYYLETDHSDYCQMKSNKSYTNLADINSEINNYKNFKDELINYLNINPVIKYGDFKEKAINLYYKNNCNFKILDNTFKNLYYNWRANTNLHTKFAIFNWNKTLDGKEYLREYKFSLLYNNTGKKLFEHEHIIYCSNYFIKKLKEAIHWYIDGTWIYPRGFKQLIIILYYDKNSKKRYPGLFALINNKTIEGYLELFNKIKSIITIENTKELKLESYSIDFEKALITSLGLIFKGIRQIGCYFHYCKNIRKSALKYKIITTNKSKNNEFLNQIYSMPFKYKGNKSNIDTILNQFRNEGYNKFIDYFINQWIPFFLNNMLNYSNLNKNIRSNSYIENYNRRIKLKLSKYLYGKNKSLITWPILLYFIINEEQEYRNEIYDKESNLEEKFSLNYKMHIEDNNVSKIKKELLNKSEKNVSF